MVMYKWDLSIIFDNSINICLTVSNWFVDPYIALATKSLFLTEISNTSMGVISVIFFH